MRWKHCTSLMRIPYWVEQHTVALCPDKIILGTDVPAEHRAAFVNKLQMLLQEA
jgi:hypothetical protein